MRRRPLHACPLGLPELVAFYVEHGAIVDSVNAHGTPLAMQPYGPSSCTKSRSTAGIILICRMLLDYKAEGAPGMTTSNLHPTRRPGTAGHVLMHMMLGLARPSMGPSTAARPSKCVLKVLHAAAAQPWSAASCCWSTGLLAPMPPWILGEAAAWGLKRWAAGWPQDSERGSVWNRQVTQACWSLAKHCLWPSVPGLPFVICPILSSLVTFVWNLGWEAGKKETRIAGNSHDTWNTSELVVASWGTEWTRSEWHWSSAETVNGATCANVSSADVCSVDDRACFGTGLSIWKSAQFSSLMKTVFNKINPCLL